MKDKKETQKIYSVYCLSFENGDRYVGISSQLNERLAQHQINSLRRDSFSYEVLHSGLSKEEALRYEATEINDIPKESRLNRRVPLSFVEKHSNVLKYRCCTCDVSFSSSELTSHRCAPCNRLAASAYSFFRRYRPGERPDVKKLVQNFDAHGWGYREFHEFDWSLATRETIEDFSQVSPFSVYILSWKNGDRYVGFTGNLKKRVSEHRSASLRMDDFSVQVLRGFDNKQEALEFERKMIAAFSSTTLLNYSGLRPLECNICSSFMGDASWSQNFRRYCKRCHRFESRLNMHAVVRGVPTKVWRKFLNGVRLVDPQADLRHKDLKNIDWDFVGGLENPQEVSSWWMSFRKKHTFTFSVC